MPTAADLIVSHESPIMGAKYISVVGLTCLVYDYLLHFNDELTDIWLDFGKKTMLKSWFLLGRYCAIIVVGYHAISLGIFNTKMETKVNLSFCGAALIVPISCETWVIVAIVFCAFSLIGTEGIVIYRLRSLWHFNRPITRAIVVMVVVVFVSAAVSMSIEAVELKDLFITVPFFPGCLFNPPSSKPSISTLVIGTVFVIWDFFNICIFTFNTFATPYLCSSEILERFRRDGGRYFLCLLVVHLLYLLTSAFGQSSRVSTIPLVAALTAVINARIFHGIALEAEKCADEFNVTLPKIIR